MGKNRYKLARQEFQPCPMQKEEREMDEDEYEAWLDEVEEAQENWDQYCEEIELDIEG